MQPVRMKASKVLLVTFSIYVWHSISPLSFILHLSTRSVDLYVFFFLMIRLHNNIINMTFDSVLWKRDKIVPATTVKLGEYARARSQ